MIGCVSFTLGWEAVELRIVDALLKPRGARVITYQPAPHSIITLADRASDVTPHVRLKRSNSLARGASSGAWAGRRTA